MSFKNIRARHGGSDARGTLNRAVRAEIPGGALLLDARAAVQSESERPNPRRHPAQIRAIREMARALDSILDTLRKAIIESYGAGGGETGEAPKKETAARAVSDTEEGEATPTERFNPRPQAAPTLSLAALQPSSLGSPRDNEAWTPSAAQVELMGHVSDAEGARLSGVSAASWAKARERLGIAPYEADKDAHFWTPAMDRLLGTDTDDALGRKWGRSAEAVRRRREKLGIAPTRKEQAWTPDRLAVLAREPDNERAAAELGISVAAVKTARSRLGKAKQE